MSALPIRVRVLRSALASCLACASLAHGYEVNTHEAMSQFAVAQSEYKRYLPDIGLISADKKFAWGPSLFDKKLSFVEWIREGARKEDDNPRFLNHFYNPLNGQGLSGFFSGMSSLTWGLEPSDIAEQEYSYRDAKGYFYNGLTLTSNVEREANLARAFRTLGDVMHLIQDLAQPQHTRNEAHPLSFYENYTGSLAILPFTGYPAVYSVTEPTAFNQAANFWHTGENSAAGVSTGVGMADYSNRGFVTFGTNFRGTTDNIHHDANFPSPDGAGVQIEKIPIASLVTPFETDPPLTGEIWFVNTPVSDTYRGTQTLNRTSSYSLFSADLKRFVGAEGFTLNRFNFDASHKLLIPRAVGYSAGLLNYFFRGQMEVSLPDDKIYAIVDHTPDDLTAAGCGTPCGFRKVKLQLKNTTPNEAMTDGTLVLVAKYHLNNCYLANLAGEFGAPTYTGPECRSPEESIVVSKTLEAPSVSQTTFQPLTFSFSDDTPIPINATDLYLQVVFRGTLGQETDAVAVSTVNVSEPTYLIFGNYNDYQAIYNSDGTFASTTPFGSGDRASLNIQIRFNAARATPTAESLQLRPGDFHRIAVLTDQPTVDYSLSERYLTDATFLTRPWSFGATINQTDDVNGAINYPTYVTLRHITPTEWAYTPDLPGSVLFWIPGYLCIDGTVTCDPVDKTIDAIARRYPPFEQPTPKPIAIDF